MEFLAIKLVGYLQINRVDMAEKTLATMKSIEEDSCLVTLCHSWITLHNPNAPVQAYDNLIAGLNELSDKFGYSLKTYNLLGTVLLIKGEIEKANQIFKSALEEFGVFKLADNDPMLSPHNKDLVCIIYNYIKCNALMNLHSSIVSDSYR